MKLSCHKVDIVHDAVETVASHISALAWMGLRRLPKKPQRLPERVVKPARRKTR